MARCVGRCDRSGQPSATRPCADADHALEPQRPLGLGSVANVSASLLAQRLMEYLGAPLSPHSSSRRSFAARHEPTVFETDPYSCQDPPRRAERCRECVRSEPSAGARDSPLIGPIRRALSGNGPLIRPDQRALTRHRPLPSLHRGAAAPNRAAASARPRARSRREAWTFDPVPPRCGTRPRPHPHTPRRGRDSFRREPRRRRSGVAPRQPGASARHVQIRRG